MLRVTVEFIPLGQEAYKTTLHTLEIINIGTGDAELGDYEITLNRQHIGGIRAYRRERGALDLVRLALGSAEAPDYRDVGVSDGGITHS